MKILYNQLLYHNILKILDNKLLLLLLLLLL